MSIINEIKNGESKKVEFKSIMPSSDKIMKTAIAFSNCAGGKLIIGVEDDGNVVGISDDDIFEIPDKISNIVYDGCYPTILPEIYTENIDDKIVLVVEFYPGNLKPYYIKSKKKHNGVYVRIGATNKQADEQIILEMERQKRNICFDEEICYDSNINSEHIKKLINDLKKLSSKDVDETTLKNLKLLKEENGAIYSTNGLVLLLAHNNIFDYAKIRCARFKGIDTTEFIDSKDLEGSLYNQVEDAMKFIKMYIEKQSIITELQRSDKYSIPLVAIREALVNAVVHRDYSISGADIKIAIFDDRIEILSPGSLPKSLDTNDIRAGRSEVRNKVIARFFKEIKYIEQWGTGIRRIISKCNEENLPDPIFKEVGEAFKVIIYKNRKTINTIYMNNNKIKEGSLSNEITGGESSTYCKYDDGIYSEDNKNAIGDHKNVISDDKCIVSDDKNAIGDDKTIIGDGNLIVSGSGSSVDAHKLIDNNKKVELDNVSIISKYLFENEFIVTSTAMELIGLKTTATKNLLRKMVSLGLIEAVGEGKARRYIMRR